MTTQDAKNELNGIVGVASCRVNAVKMLMDYGFISPGDTAHSLFLADCRDEQDAFPALRDLCNDKARAERLNSLNCGNTVHANMCDATMDLWFAVVYGEPFYTSARRYL